jgi:hypothetical protein
MKRQIIEFDPKTPRKVGKYYEDRKRPLMYVDIKTDDDKWVDSSKYLPGDFDICFCKTECNHIISGWHTGFEWDGAFMKKEYNISFWKLNYEC